MHALAKKSTQPIPDERYRRCNIHKMSYNFFHSSHKFSLPFAEHCIIINAWQAKNIPNRIKIFISSLTEPEVDVVMLLLLLCVPIKHVCHNLIKIVFTFTHTHSHSLAEIERIVRDEKIENAKMHVEMQLRYCLHCSSCSHFFALLFALFKRVCVFI
jgi:hypothetical protein